MQQVAQEEYDRPFVKYVGLQDLLENPLDRTEGFVRRKEELLRLLKQNQILLLCLVCVKRVDIREWSLVR